MTNSRMKSDERREQILEKAAEVFAAHGLSGARTRDIAKACGINEAIIYQHFDGKEDLFKESLLSIQTDLLKDLYGAVEKEKTGLAALRTAMNCLVNQLFANSKLRAYILHGVASATLDSNLKEWACDWFEKQNEFIRSQILRGIDDGSIRPDTDVETEVWHIKGIGWACLLGGIFGLSDSEVKSLAEKLYNRIFDNMATGQH